MAKCRTFRKTKPGKPIPVTARELESFMLEHKGKFNSREYDKFERMELTFSRFDAIMRSPVYCGYNNSEKLLDGSNNHIPRYYCRGGNVEGHGHQSAKASEIHTLFDSLLHQILPTKGRSNPAGSISYGNYQAKTSPRWGLLLTW